MRPYNELTSIPIQVKVDSLTAWRSRRIPRGFTDVDDILS